MFDNISIRLNNFSANRFESLLSNHLNIDFLNRDLSYKGNRYHIKWKNLRIEFYPNQQELWIKNSIHKFYNSQIANWGEYNHDDFTYRHFAEVVNYFCKVLECNPIDLKLFGRFEYGLNINLNIKPFDIISRFDSIVTTSSNQFYTVENQSGKPFERICQFTDYSVKFYDKSRQSQIPGKILRFEIANNKISETRKLFGKENLSLEDLLDKSNWEKCFNKLIKTYLSVRKTPMAKDLTPEEYAQIKAYTDPFFIKDHKVIINNKALYNKVFQECKEIYFKVMSIKGNFFDDLKNSFQVKFNNLIYQT